MKFLNYNGKYLAYRTFESEFLFGDFYEVKLFNDCVCIAILTIDSKQLKTL